MTTLSRLIIAVALSWAIAGHYGMTPMDGVAAMRLVADKL